LLRRERRARLAILDAEQRAASRGRVKEAARRWALTACQTVPEQPRHHQAARRPEAIHPDPGDRQPDHPGRSRGWGGRIDTAAEYSNGPWQPPPTTTASTPC